MHCGDYNNLIAKEVVNLVVCVVLKSIESYYRHSNYLNMLAQGPNTKDTTIKGAIVTALIINNKLLKIIYRKYKP